MKDLTTQLYKSFYKYKILNLDDLIYNVNFSWQLKEKLSKHISLSTVKKLISDAQSKNIGAKILSAVSLNTDYIIIGTNAGSKAKKALELNIKILSEDEFLKKIKS